MPNEPVIKALSNRRRLVLFYTLLLIFFISLPVVIFYTTGYRLQFDDDQAGIVTTGGMYIDTISTDVEVLLNDEQIMRPRLFRSAYYLQNVASGQQRVVVQAEDSHTWVKELPVDPHIVIEALAFTMPTTPQLRPITQYLTPADVAVYNASSTFSEVLTMATITDPYTISTSTATTSLVTNPEFAFVDALFASSSSPSRSVFAKQEEVEDFRFASDYVADQATSTTVETPVIKEGDMRLLAREGELYARWEGSMSDVPHYFCVANLEYASTSQRYGEHVAEAVQNSLTTTSSSTVTAINSNLCRNEVKLDRLRQDVYLYDFLPGFRDLVLLHLSDGVYVTEIDDRSWQNTQPLLRADDMQVLVENDIIYIRVHDLYFELVPELIN